MARPRLPADDDSPPSRQFVTALSRGLAVLEAFVPEGAALGNQEIAARTGLPKPTVSRIAYTLTEMGYLVHAADREKYRLGPRVLGLARAFGAGTKLADVAVTPMQALADATRGTVALGQADGDEMVYLVLRRSVSRIMLRQDVGSRIPIATTAMGHAWLHTLPEPQRGAAIERLLARAGDRRVQLADSLARTGQEMQAQGFCVMAGQWEAEINGAATAFLLDDGCSVLALNIGGPAFWLPERALRGRVGAHLLEAREALLQAGIGRVMVA